MRSSLPGLGLWVSVVVLKGLLFHKCLLWVVAPCGHRDVCSEPSPWAKATRLYDLADSPGVGNYFA